MAGRAAAYQSGGGDSQAATLDSLSKKLSDDLRQHIKSLGSYSLLSEEWLTTADSLRHIAEIAVMEQKLPKQEGQDSMTLWDKEDMAVRMVLEEGKLNMCLRVLQEYKTMVRPAGALDTAAGAAVGALGLTQAEVRTHARPTHERPFQQLLAGFTVALCDEVGVYTCSCQPQTSQVEAVQTIDLPLLCAHCAEVLGNSAATGPPTREASTSSSGVDGTQEALTVQYLASVGAAGDGIDEDRVAELVQECHLVHNVVLLLRRDKDVFRKEYKAGAAKFLAYMCDTEHFQTHVGDYFPDDGAKAAFVALQDEIIGPMVAEHTVERKEVRPLMDAIMKMKRSM